MICHIWTKIILEHEGLGQTHFAKRLNLLSNRYNKRDSVRYVSDASSQNNISNHWLRVLSKTCVSTCHSCMSYNWCKLCSVQLTNTAWQKALTIFICFQTPLWFKGREKYCQITPSKKDSLLDLSSRSAKNQNFIEVTQKKDENFLKGIRPKPT